MKGGGVVVLTGAGISAESGIPTFRAEDGLWENHRVEEVATPAGFRRNPALVHRFYNERRRKLTTVQPNAAHDALAAFEAHCSREAREFLLVTQNIDDLHERAGSRRLVHMHGELLKSWCEHCDTRATTVSGNLSTDSVCPSCGSAGGLRPDIVWFGEMPYHMERIERALAHCALFVAVGTSGNVYPAAGFVRLAARVGARCVELNLERTGGAFTDGIYGRATTVVPTFFSDVK